MIPEQNPVFIEIAGSNNSSGIDVEAGEVIINKNQYGFIPFISKNDKHKKKVIVVNVGDKLSDVRQLLHKEYANFVHEIYFPGTENKDPPPAEIFHIQLFIGDDPYNRETCLAVTSKTKFDSMTIDDLELSPGKTYNYNTINMFWLVANAERSWLWCLFVSFFLVPLMPVYGIFFLFWNCLP